MASNNDSLFSSKACKGFSHGALQSALVGASRAVSNRNSTVIDQFRPNMFPVQFHTIRLNTDLNHVPQDWAKTKFQCNGFNTSHESAFSSFSSVNMAHNYKHLVGKVDVISSSKNIKDLLKMPYQKSPQISLMVHRLGKTLLLEEFDVHKNLLRKDVEDWQWLKDFFRHYMKEREDKNSSLAVMSSPKKDPLSDEMYRNLIRHSITASVAGNACITVEPSQDVPQNFPHVEESQDLKGFHHESLWKFQGRSMLVDSDLPIFGTDSKFPCISLRLRDSPPISVLTGLDYWLDNLMSNVPEVAMVYHLNGFVQKYEILRTEDIPHIENSSFDPEEVMELARNVMAFIKSRAAVEGHTYWLYKSQNDDMVKLYDLTEYCKKELRQDDNPFTVPVGLLCYHVGRNLKMSGQRRSADSRAMLENCLRLLVDEEKHPQICADANYQLADMWVPDKSLQDIWHGDGKIADPPDDLYDEDDCSTEDSYGPGPSEQETNETEEQSHLTSLKAVPKPDNRLSPRKSVRNQEEKNEVALQELVIRGMIKRKAWDVLKVCRIAGETDERCREALNRIRKGLTCIDKDVSRLSRPGACKTGNSTSSHDAYTPAQNGFLSKGVDVERDQIRVAKPFIPIPLHYSPIKPNGTDPAEKKSSENACSTETCEEVQDETSKKCEWHKQLKLQLLRKAAISFYILADQFHEGLQKRGHALRYVRYGLHCYECVLKHTPRRGADSWEEEVYFHLIHLAAKVRSCLDSKSWESSKKDYNELDEVEAAILHSAQAILQTPREAWVYTWSENEESNLETARVLYKKVMKMKIFDKISPEIRSVIKKQHAVCVMNIGHILKEELARKVSAGKETYESIQPLFDRVLGIYKESSSLFLKMNEKNTAALCHLNIYSLYEQVAYTLQQLNHDKLNPISKEEAKVHQKMWDACDKALSMFEKNESADAQREMVYTKLRSKNYQLATRYFPATDVYHLPAFKPAKDLLNKSLSYCILDLKSRHVRDSQVFGAIVHYNLARFCKTESDRVHVDSPHHEALMRKMYDHVNAAFALYGHLKKSVSSIEIKRYILHSELETYDNLVKESTRANRKKLLRSCLTHCCELKYAVDLIHLEQHDTEDTGTSLTMQTTKKAVLVVVDFLNKIFIRLLKLEKSGELHKTVKSWYASTLLMTTRETVNYIAYPLSLTLTDISAALASDLFN